MKIYFDIIKNTALFDGISDEDIEKSIECLDGKVRKFDKDEYVLTAGDKTENIGLLLDGNIFIIQEDFWGNRNILAKLSSGQIFAESFACSHEIPLNVSAVADTPCAVMFLNINRIMNPCASGCEFHSRMIYNLLSELANKNLRLNEKLTHLSKRSTREKLMSFLSSESVRHSSDEFEIQFNRQQLADYLSVDRSAMSNELCKLRDQGILTFNRNHFHLNYKIKQT